MKKNLLVLVSAAILGSSSLIAQTPDAIYIATWETMQDLGQPVTPDTNDPKLTYNASTGCYEGEIIDWPRTAVNPYNAKIPYSVAGNVVTYYGVAGSTQSFVFNTEDSQSFTFTENTNPSSFKGFALGMANNTSVADVKISMNLESKQITFTKFESGQGAEIPTLVSVNPKDGSTISLTDNQKTVGITLTFSGEVTSMEALFNGIALPSEPNATGTVWAIEVPVERILTSDDDDEDENGEESDNTPETNKVFHVIIQKVYADNLPVSFDGGNPVLNLTYTLTNLPDTSGIDTISSQEGTLKVYNLKGVNVLNAGKSGDLQNLKSGIYIINGKKVLVK